MDFYESPPSYELLEEKLHELKREFSFLRLFSIGKSVLGRKIYAVGIGSWNQANLFVGAVHAQEWLTTSVLVLFLENLCRSVQMGTALSNIRFFETLSTKGALFVPMLNPDGVEIALNGPKSAKHLHARVQKIMNTSPQSWQANAHGIDLNHNFDAGFELCKQAEQKAGIFAPSPRQYGGKTAHSEPETKALVRLCKNLSFPCAYAFHSQGEEIFYEYGKHTPTVSKYIASLLSSYSDYQPVHQTGLASHGGFKDWFIDTFHKPSFTIEIGKGENPLPITDLCAVYERVGDMLAIMTAL